MVSNNNVHVTQIFSIASSNYRNVKELMLPIGYVAVMVMYMFLANYIAQDLTDHNRRIFTTV